MLTSKVLVFSLVIISILSTPSSIKDFIYNNRSNYTNKTSIQYNKNNTIRILEVYPNLYEYKRNQTIYLYMNTPIYPKFLTNITLTSKYRSNYYYPETECTYENNLAHGKVMTIKCNLDLTYMSKGDYYIQYFLYNYEPIYDGETSIEIQGEKRENHTDKIVLTGIDAMPYEYSINQNFTFYFNITEIVNIYYMRSITFKNGNGTLFNIDLKCNYKDSLAVYCLGDFEFIPASDPDYYYLLYLTYGNDSIYPYNEMKFKVISKPVVKDLKLLYVYGDAYLNQSYLNMTFNKRPNSNNIRFDLRDTKIQNKTTPLYHSDCYTLNTTLNCLFYFLNTSEGLYTIDYYYTEYNITKYYVTNITLDVKDRGKYDESELLDVYHNFKRFKNNQTAFFSFYGQNKTSNLQYIVLRDENSRINVLQTYDCQLIRYYNNDDKYDIKCVLNLMNVNRNNYVVSEYYINNQHYYAKNKIDIVVQ